MQPVIALVGRPNVGKSTLFNKLTRTQDALVADFPGLTRDRQYGEGKVGGWPYIVIDTGGLNGEAETLSAAMAVQTMAAIKEADLVVFIVDGRAGMNPVDEDIANNLRRHSDKVVLCVNKIDGIGEDRAMLDFYALGYEHTIAIAASHNRGMSSLMEEVAVILGVNPDDYEAPRRYKPSEQPSSKRTDDIRIAFIGRPNVGKSTLINRLIGEDRVIAYDKPGTTRDAVSVPFERAGKQYTLIDTAGVRRRGKVSEKVEIFSIIKSMQAVDKSNVVVMLVDGNDGFTDQDLHLLGYVIEKGRALIVAVNKWDELDGEQREELKESLERRVEFLRFTRIHFISALHGSGVGDLFKSINKAYASAFMDMATPKLTRLLAVAVEKHQPPMVNGRRIKLRYAHQGGVNPPIIVVHGNQLSKVPMSYQRYLMNYFTKMLRMFGTPLRIEFKEGDNPYAGQRTRRPVQGGRKNPDPKSRAPRKQ
ncbi:MAG: ribosome biogenesis GTPase Der [Granulosicoccaceae bacterium]